MNRRDIVREGYDDIAATSRPSVTARVASAVWSRPSRTVCPPRVGSSMPAVALGRPRWTFSQPTTLSRGWISLASSSNGAQAGPRTAARSGVWQRCRSRARSMRSSHCTRSSTSRGARRRLRRVRARARTGRSATDRAGQRRWEGNNEDWLETGTEMAGASTAASAIASYWPRPASPSPTSRPSTTNSVGCSRFSGRERSPIPLTPSLPVARRPRPPSRSRGCPSKRGGASATDEVLLGRPSRRENDHPGVTSGAHRPPGPLCALSTGPTQSGSDEREFGVRQVDTLVADAGDDQRGQFAAAELVEQLLPAGVWRLAADKRRSMASLMPHPVEVLDEHCAFAAGFSASASGLAEFSGVAGGGLSAACPTWTYSDCSATSPHGRDGSTSGSAT